jgi:hypothetical protein
MGEITLDEYAESLLQEVLAGAEEAEDGQFRELEFTRLALETLVDAGEIEPAEVCFHQARGIKANGYVLAEDETRLDLFVSICTHTIPPTTVPRSEVETALKRLRGFLEKSIGGYHVELEEASEAFDMTERIHEVRARLEKARLYLLTDGLCNVDKFEPETVGKVDIAFHIWDIKRLYRVAGSGVPREAIEIDFVAKFGQPIPCISVPESDEYRALLAVFPGIMLAGLYEDYRDRLLERNVRCFLQSRGKVNKGIRETLLEKPGRFLAYNNGISATASGVETVSFDGGLGIRRVTDFQIVNGGQTTASLHQAMFRDGVDISAVHVQAKLAEITPTVIDEMVPLISRFANSQNKVSEPDFYANDPYHRRMEELSRTVWAPAKDGMQRETKWFYERARGQYLVAKTSAGTAARQKVFVTENPTSQKFTKTDLAKFENTWFQLPHLVSRGAEKNFREFTLGLKERAPASVGREHLERLVAKAILFRSAEGIIDGLAFGGYRANIVTYTLAWISWKTEQRIDLERIWKTQALSPALEGAIRDFARAVHEHITHPPGAANVTDWCKKEACWKTLKERRIAIANELEGELVRVERVQNEARLGERGSGDDAAPGAMEEVGEVPANAWFRLSRWAKQTGNLQPWQRSLAFSLGRIASSGRVPSVKQATQGKRILDEVRDLGFRVESGPEDAP